MQLQLRVQWHSLLFYNPRNWYTVFHGVVEEVFSSLSSNNHRLTSLSVDTRLQLIFTNSEVKSVHVRQLGRMWLSISDNGIFITSFSVWTTNFEDRRIVWFLKFDLYVFVMYSSKGLNENDPKQKRPIVIFKLLLILCCHASILRKRQKCGMVRPRSDFAFFHSHTLRPVSFGNRKREKNLLPTAESISSGTNATEGLGWQDFQVHPARL